MNILYLHITQNPGGVEKRFFQYYKYILQKTDNSYTVIISRTFLSKVIEKPHITDSNRVLIYGFKWKNTNKITRYLDYAHLIILLLGFFSCKFDIAHCPTSSRHFLFLVRCKRKVISAVSSIPSKMKKDASAFFFRMLIKEGAFVDCLDENIMKTIAILYPEAIQRLFVAPCSFIDYSQTGCSYNEKKHEIAFAGRLIMEKGADWLLNSLIDIVNRTQFNIIIMGKGDMEQDFIKLIEKYSLYDRITLCYVPNPVELLKRTKIFLSLQKNENYPSQSLIEAMATGNAIIASNVGLTSSIVRNDWGWLISSQKELIDVLVEVENNDFSKMGMLAESFIKSNHTVQRFHSYLMSIYCS